MAASARPATALGAQPAPDGMSWSLMLFCLAGGPVAWSVQLLVNYALASHACYPYDVPSAHVLPGWHWVWPLVLVLNLIAVAVALAAGFLSLRTWRASPGASAARFLSLCGIMSGFGFLAAIIFDTVVVFAVPTCAG